MKPSLTRWHRRLKTSGAGVALTVMIALAMTLVLSPCCEAGSIISTPVQTDTAVHAGGHGDDHDPGTPVTDGTCVAWADESINTAGNASLLPTETPDLSLLWLIEKPSGPGERAGWLLPSHYRTQTTVPIYLRFAHLLF